MKVAGIPGVGSYPPQKTMPPAWGHRLVVGSVSGLLSGYEASFHQVAVVPKHLLRNGLCPGRQFLELGHFPHLGRRELALLGAFLQLLKSRPGGPETVEPEEVTHLPLGKLTPLLGLRHLQNLLTAVPDNLRVYLERAHSHTT